MTVSDSGGSVVLILIKLGLVRGCFVDSTKEGTVVDGGCSVDSFVKVFIESSGLFSTEILSVDSAFALGSVEVVTKRSRAGRRLALRDERNSATDTFLGRPLRSLTAESADDDSLTMLGFLLRKFLPANRDLKKGTSVADSWSSCCSCWRVCRPSSSTGAASVVRSSSSTDCDVVVDGAGVVL